MTQRPLNWKQFRSCCWVMICFIITPYSWSWMGLWLWNCWRFCKEANYLKGYLFTMLKQERKYPATMVTTATMMTEWFLHTVSSFAAEG
jgi:hypothetical protein